MTARLSLADGRRTLRKRDAMGCSRDRRKIIRFFLIFILAGLSFFSLEIGQAAAADALDTWHVRKENTAAYGVGYGNGVFVIVGDGGEILTSADGAAWISRSSGTIEDLSAVAYGNGMLVAVGMYGVILTSSDMGATWTLRTFGISEDFDFYGLVYGNGKFVAVGEKYNWSTGEFTGVIANSLDGKTWSSKNFGVDVTFRGLAFGDGKFVVVGEDWNANGGVIATSSNGLDWVVKSSGPGEALSGVVYGKGSFIATGYSDDGGRIRSSQDGGATWQVRTTGLSGNIFLHCIAYGGGIFTVAGENWSSITGLILTSPDGAAWTLRTAAAQQSALNSVAYGQGTFVAVTGDGTIIQSDPLPSLQSIVINGGAAYTATREVNLALTAGDPGSAVEMQFSHDSGSWSAPEPFSAAKSWTLTDGDGEKQVYAQFRDPLGNWSSAVSASIILDTLAPAAGAWPPAGAYEGTQLVILSADEPWATIFYTLDGTSPTVNSFSYQAPILIGESRTLRYFARDAAGNSGAVRTENYQISYHPLDSWHQRGVNPSAYALAYGNGVFVSVGDSGDIMTSPDGIAWTSRPSATSENLAAVAYEGGVFAAVGDFGAIITSADNGASWTSRTVAMNEYLLAVTAGNGKFIAVGDAGIVLISSDQGLTWASQHTATTASLWGVAYGNGVFAAVGDDGTIMTSADGGATWTARNSGAMETLWAITYGGGMFAAVGDNGTILTSADNGATWTPQTVGVSADLVFYGIAYGNGAFAAVGESYVSGTGRIVTSSDGATWISRTFPSLQDQMLAVAFGKGSFIALSSAGAILQSGLSKGDINNDQRTDLLDLLFYLKVLNGEHPAGIRTDYSLSGTDPDGDGRIGLADAILILQKISGLR